MRISYPYLVNMSKNIKNLPISFVYVKKKRNFAHAYLMSASYVCFFYACRHSARKRNGKG